MAEFTCESCAYVLKASALGGAPACPNCGGVMLKSAVYRRNLAARKAQQEARARRVSAAKRWGIEPVEWAVLELPQHFGGLEIQKALDEMADEGWDFVFFRQATILGESAEANIVFKRKIIAATPD